MSSLCVTQSHSTSPRILLHYNDSRNETACMLHCYCFKSHTACTYNSILNCSTVSALGHNIIFSIGKHQSSSLCITGECKRFRNPCHHFDCDALMGRPAWGKWHTSKHVSFVIPKAVAALVISCCPGIRFLLYYTQTKRLMWHKPAGDVFWFVSFFKLEC
jgi:hypothetical protein